MKERKNARKDEWKQKEERNRSIVEQIKQRRNNKSKQERNLNWKENLKDGLCIEMKKKNNENSSMKKKKRMKKERMRRKK